MTDMVVLAFDSEGGADMGREKLVELDNDYELNLVNAVEVVRHKDGKIKVKDIRSLSGIGALGGAFWGTLFGLLFLVPALGLAVGAVSGAVAGHFAHFGVTKDYLKQIEASVVPGTSALAILAANVTVDKVVQKLSPLHPKVIRSSLSTEQEAKLNEAFGSITK